MNTADKPRPVEGILGRFPTREELRRQFQAKMWREYAQDYDRPGLARDWVEKVLRVPRADCLRRARAALAHNAEVERRPDNGGKET